MEFARLTMWLETPRHWLTFFEFDSVQGHRTMKLRWLKEKEMIINGQRIRTMQRIMMRSIGLAAMLSLKRPVPGGRSFLNKYLSKVKRCGIGASERRR
ncbi:hypothetical protein O9929_22385 [Vibrio lentus]|nr:hypothetical protein [Vibrio lentus]